MTSKTKYTTTISYLQDAGVTFTRTVVTYIRPVIAEGVINIEDVQDETFNGITVPLTSIFDIQVTAEEEN